MNKIGAVALLALVLLSCRSEAPKEAWRKMDYPVLFSLAGKEGSMRAAEKGNSHSAALTNECTIENLTVVVFTDRRVSNVPLALEKVIANEQLQQPQGGNGKISFEMGMAGTYHLEIIANAYPNGDAVAKQAFLDKLKQGLSYDQFKKLLFDRALPEHGGSGFAMLSAEPIKVETKKQQPADAGKIVLQRLACRFDIFNKLPADLKLTKVTLQNQIKASYLVTQKDIPSGTVVTTEKSYTPNNDWFTATLVSGGIYSYENPVRGATKLLLEGTYKDKPWQKVIEFKNILEQPIATKRNHLYRIYLTKGNGTTPGGTDPADADQIHYGIEVLDWNDDLSIDYTDADVMNSEVKMINPLAYVAEANINPEGTGFVTDLYANNVSGYYSFNSAVDKFKNIKIGGEAYHLPSVYEWQAILPRYNSSSTSENKVVYFNKATKGGSDQYVVIAGKRIYCAQHFEGSGDGVCYAIRFMRTAYLSAWKYEYVKLEGHQVMRITARNLTEDGVTIADIAKKDFWEQNNTGDVVRIFPASGYKMSGNIGPLESLEVDGYFWSSSGDRDDMCMFMYFTPEGAATAGNINNFHYGDSIRLFKDTL